MRFESVRIAGLAELVPDEVVSSESIELALGPLYARHALSVGRLELMTGIRERRFFPRGARPSSPASQAGAQALAASAVPRDRIGLLIHASVCRDFLEPATASVVHRALELPTSCAAFDLSNACLGFVNAMMLASSAIEARQIDAALIVAAEDGRPLVETTIDALSKDPKAGKRELKAAFASLTIGSGAAACVLAHASLAPNGDRLLGGVARAATEHVDLCQGATHEGAAGPLMETDSEGLLHAGNALAARTFEDFLRELGWARDSIDRVATHQVGVAHRRLLLGTMGIDQAIDYPTVETLGNIGSVSLPLSYARARKSGFIRSGHRTGMLGIASGLHCLMLGVEAAGTPS
jgi:3-oxoacyl-[acyl-carrier-protein] synthase-3